MKLLSTFFLPLLLFPGVQGHLMTSLLKSSRQEMMQHRRSLLPNINCDHARVKDWVQRHIEGGRCQDFFQMVGGIALCQKYTNITDLAQCDELDDTPLLTVSLESGAGASEAEHCRFFASHLLPHPYFVDIDSIVPVFGSSLKAPINHTCRESEAHDCVVAVHYMNEDRPLAVGETFAPTPASFTEVLPCTQCDYEYEDDDICFDADCRELFECNGMILPEDNTNVEQIEARSGPEFVKVCFRTKRSDLFSFVEIRQGNFYGCSMQTEEKLWTTEFHAGVMNVQKMEFRLGVEELRADIDNYGADFCELKVDGTVCNSCALCGANDTALVAFDCTNIATNAVTSCHSEKDFLFGISHKLLILEDGYPTVPTPAPARPQASLHKPTDESPAEDPPVPTIAAKFPAESYSFVRPEEESSGAVKKAGASSALLVMGIVGMAF